MSNATNNGRSLYEVKREADVNHIKVDKKAEPSKVARAAVNYAEEMSAVYEIGPREYEVHPNDGAAAFVRAVGTIFGTEMAGKAIPPSFFGPGQAPTLRSVPVQHLIYKIKDTQFTKETLSSYGMRELVAFAQNHDVAVPNYVNEDDFFPLMDSIIAESKIVGTYMGEMQVPFGLVTIFTRDGDEFGLATIDETEDGQNFLLTIKTRKSNTDVANELIKEVEHQFEVGSIYKGRAYDFNEQAFFTPNPTIYEDLVLTVEQETLIKGIVLHRVKYRERIMEQHPKLAKATVLLPGDYGTGKTMTNMASAWYAMTHGWTVVRWMPARDEKKDFGKMLKFASRLGPVLIIIEDVEKMLTGDENQFSVILDALDGATTKVSNVVTLMTTNFPDRIPKAVWRRFHGVVKYGPLDEAGIERMIKVQLRETWEGFDVDEDLRSTLYNIDTIEVDRGKNRDLSRIVKMLKDYGFNQWLISQVLSRALVFSLNQKNSPLCITEDNLLAAAESLLPQYDLYNDADHGPGAERTLDDALAELVTAVMVNHKMTSDGQFVAIDK